MAQFAIALLAAMTLTPAFFVWRFFQQVRSLRKRYAGITDLEAEITGARDRLRQTKREQQDFDSENEQRRLTRAVPEDWREWIERMTAPNPKSRLAAMEDARGWAGDYQ